MKLDKIESYQLSAGGIGDCLLSISIFYDQIPENQKETFIFLANNKKSIIELLNLFPKVQTLVLDNNFSLLTELYFNQKCKGTGILPRDLNYKNWYQINVFDQYKVNQFPDFVNLFTPLRVESNKPKQLILQSQGSLIEGFQKQRVLTKQTLNIVYNTYQNDYNIIDISNTTTFLSILDILRLIKGSDLVIGVDSFAKSFSAMCRIPTIVYDNLYSQEYLNNFKDHRDYGHHIFIDNWEYIEFRKQ